MNADQPQMPAKPVKADTLSEAAVAEHFFVTPGCVAVWRREGRIPRRFVRREVRYTPDVIPFIEADAAQAHGRPAPAKQEG